MSALKRSARRRKERFYDSYEEEDDMEVSSRPRRKAREHDADDMKACYDILVELMDHPDVRTSFLKFSNSVNVY
jgi:hypothetical protein